MSKPHLLLPRPQRVVIVTLEFDNAAAFIAFLRSISNLTYLNPNLANVNHTNSVDTAPSTFVAFLSEGNNDDAIVDAFHVREVRENARSKGKARALDDDNDNDTRILLPYLQVVRLRNACLRAFVCLARFRRQVGRPVKRWELHERARWIEYDQDALADVGGWDAVQAECAERSREFVWVKVNDDDDDEEDEEDCHEQDDDREHDCGALQADGVATSVVGSSTGILNGAISGDDEDEYP